MEAMDPALPWMRAAAAGVELPIREDDDPESGAIVARYVDAFYVAVLWIYEDDSYETGWYHDIVIFKWMPDGELERRGTGGSDWYGPPGTRPPADVWLSGFSSGMVGGPTFLTGAVSDLDYLRLLRHFGTGEPLVREDAPSGAFIVRIE